MRKRIKDGNFHLVAGIWIDDNGWAHWAVHIFVILQKYSIAPFPGK